MMDEKNLPKFFYESGEVFYSDGNTLMYKAVIYLLIFMNKYIS